jgi:RNA polymerase sigma-70 factor, ECF subfamily
MTQSCDDAAVFTRIFDQHRTAVHAFLLGRVGDRELARDLFQETFLRVWRRLSEVRALAADRRQAWIFTVARNLTVDAYRAGAARQAAHAALQRETATQAFATNEPHARVEHGERLARLNAAILRLPEELRVILSLATVGELTSREIGDALGQPPGTIRYKLNQARTRLAAALDPED